MINLETDKRPSLAQPRAHLLQFNEKTGEIVIDGELAGMVNMQIPGEVSHAKTMITWHNRSHADQNSFAQLVKDGQSDERTAQVGLKISAENLLKSNSLLGPFERNHKTKTIEVIKKFEVYD